MKKAFENVKVGLPWEEGVQMGAQINQKQLDKILSYVDIGQEEGAKLLAGGYQLKDNGLENGSFMAPTILSDANNDMRIAQEEIFGPVATVMNKAIRVSRGVQTGRMWVNQYSNFAAGAPFGGYKKSGIGRETYKSILDAYSQTKNIFISTKEEKDGMY